MKRQINFSNSILLILFSVLIISCNQKKCCDGKHIVSNTDCCYLVDTTIDKAVTGFARETVGSISGEVDCADIAIDTLKTYVKLNNGIFTFTSVIYNLGDDDGHSVGGIVLLPPNARVISKMIKLHKGGDQISTIESQQCGAKITFCTGTNFAKNYVDSIIIRIELEKSLNSNACQYKNFSLFVYNHLPDLDLKNNYWQISDKQPCLNIEKSKGQ